MTVEVPLRRRDGSVRAVALIDAADAMLVSGYAWKLTNPGRYAAACVGPRSAQRTVYMHRLIMGLEAGDRRTVDHIDRDRLNNTRSNLRVVERAQNYQNVGARPGSSSRFRGVGWDKSKGRWRAYATVRGRSVTIGTFRDEADAAVAAAEFRRQHMPFAVA